MSDQQSQNSDISFNFFENINEDYLDFFTDQKLIEAELQLKYLENQNYESIKEKEESFKTVEIGDIIYLCYYLDAQNKLQQEGIVSGNGISSNKVQMFALNYKYNQNGLNQFRKCLFRIESKKQYVFAQEYKNLLQNKQDTIDYQFKLEMFKKRFLTEEEDNQKSLEDQIGKVEVKFGDIIQLRHLYSNTFLTLDQQKQAQQNGCIQLILQEKGCIDSYFKFMPQNVTKVEGDVMNFQDLISLASGDQQTQIYMHVADETFQSLSIDKNQIEEQLDKGIEINGSELSTQFQIKSYLNADDMEQSLKFKNKQIQNCDIVCIYNKDLNIYLSVQQRTIETYFEEKKRMIKVFLNFRYKLITILILNNVLLI